MPGGDLAVAMCDQFYVTHCAPADSVRGDAGYAVRAASVGDPAALDAAFHYPPYELPFDLWKDRPPASAAPRRLARTLHANGRVWAAHSCYLPKDTVERDRSFFSHLLLLPEADPAAVLRSWGADGWATGYPPGAPKVLPGAALPVGSLVSDASLTAFLGENPPGPTDLSVAACPLRWRASATARRDLFARALHAVLLLAAEKAEARRRLFVHVEPGVVALLLYGCVRMLPAAITDNLTFSTFEAYHRNIQHSAAEVTGTYLGAPGKGLHPDLGTTRGIALDTFVPACSTPALAGPPPRRLSAFVEVAASGRWEQVSGAARVEAGGNDLGWVEERVARAMELLHGGPTSTTPTPTVTVASPLAPHPTGTYSAPITRTSPACLLFLIDQSKSMAQPFVGGGGQSKAATVADALNRLLQNVVLRSAKADGVRDYFRVGVIGYGKGVHAGLGGSAPFDILLPISRLGDHPLRVDTRTKLIPDGAGGVIEQKVKFPVWYDPEASGQTPMCEALAAAGLAVKGFVEEFPNAYPPIVLNLTDGAPTDGNPQENARLVRSLSTSDGNVLLFNLLISSVPVPPAYFPSDEDGFTSNAAKLLFRMSSVLPPKLCDAARAEGHDLRPRARGVVLNADPTAIVRFLDIGTRVTPSGR